MKDGAGKIVQWNNQPPPCRRHRAAATVPCVRCRQSPRHQVQFKKLRSLNEKKKSVHQILPWDFAIFLVQDVNQLLVKWFTQGINLDNMYNMNIFSNIYVMHCETKKSFHDSRSN